MINYITSICKYVSGSDCNNNNCAFAKCGGWCGETFMSTSEWIKDIDDKIAWLQEIREKIIADSPN